MLTSVLGENRHLPLDSNRGHWKDGVRGEGIFVIHDDAEFHYNGHTITGAEFKALYGVEGIEYHNSEPDFSPFYMNDPYVDTVVFENSISHDREQTHKDALSFLSEKKGISKSDIKKYMKQNELTFHELDDRKTVVVIPAWINAIFTHTGGTSLQGIFEAMRQSLQNRKTGAVYRQYRTKAMPASYQELSETIKRNQTKLKNIRSRFKSK